MKKQKKQAKLISGYCIRTTNKWYLYMVELQKYTMLVADYSDGRLQISREIDI